MKVTEDLGSFIHAALFTQNKVEGCAEKKKLPCNDPARAGQNEWMIDKGPYTQRYAASHLVGDSFVTTRRRELE